MDWGFSLVGTFRFGCLLEKLRIDDWMMFSCWNRLKTKKQQVAKEYTPHGKLAQVENWSNSVSKPPLSIKSRESLSLLLLSCGSIGIFPSFRFGTFSLTLDSEEIGHAPVWWQHAGLANSWWLIDISQGIEAKLIWLWLKPQKNSETFVLRSKFIMTKISISNHRSINKR